MLKTDAVVLSLKKHKEHDFLVSFFTKDFGKVVILVRGAQKLNSKLSPFLHYPGVVRCGFVEGRHMPVLTDVDSIFTPTSSLNWRKNGALTRAATTLLEFCGLVIYERQEDRRLWNFFLEVLLDCKVGADKNLSLEDCVPLYEKWLYKLLNVLGHAPAPRSLDEIGPAPKSYSYDMLGETYGRHLNLVPPALFAKDAD